MEAPTRTGTPRIAGREGSYIYISFKTPDEQFFENIVCFQHPHTGKSQISTQPQNGAKFYYKISAHGGCLCSCSSARFLTLGQVQLSLISLIFSIGSHALRGTFPFGTEAEGALNVGRARREQNAPENTRERFYRPRKGEPRTMPPLGVQ